MLQGAISYSILSMVSLSILVMEVCEENNTMTVISCIVTIIFAGLSIFFAGKFDYDYRKLKDEVNKTNDKIDKLLKEHDIGEKE